MNCIIEVKKEITTIINNRKLFLNSVSSLTVKLQSINIIEIEIKNIDF